MNYYSDRTARLYQAGLTEEDAVSLGADLRKFRALDGEFRGGSIPTHLIHGFKRSEPYACDYHTGGSRGALLRNISRELR